VAVTIFVALVPPCIVNQRRQQRAKSPYGLTEIHELGLENTVHQKQSYGVEFDLIFRFVTLRSEGADKLYRQQHNLRPWTWIRSGQGLVHYARGYIYPIPKRRPKASRGGQLGQRLFAGRLEARDS
jgi:hypothetical protein